MRGKIHVENMSIIKMSIVFSLAIMSLVSKKFGISISKLCEEHRIIILLTQTVTKYVTDAQYGVRNERSDFVKILVTENTHSLKNLHVWLIVLGKAFHSLN